MKMSTDSEVLCLTVRRDFLLQDAIKEAKKKKFSPAKKLKVIMVFIESRDYQHFKEVEAQS